MTTEAAKAKGRKRKAGSAPASSIRPVAGIKRAMDVIEILADAENGLTVTEVAAGLGVNKSIAFRILLTHEKSGYVSKDEAHGLYRLTHKISNLGLRQMSKQHLLQHCAPLLQSLAQSTGELIRLAVVENERIFWVLSFQGQRYNLQIAPRALEISLHAHATGRAWLATMADHRAMRLMSRDGFTKHTEHTIVNPTALKDELSATRRRGYAISVEEEEIGVGAIAAPIEVRISSERTICAGVVSLAAPVSRMKRSDLEAQATPLIDLCQRLALIWPHNEVTWPSV